MGGGGVREMMGYGMMVIGIGGRERDEKGIVM